MFQPVTSVCGLENTNCAPAVLAHRVCAGAGLRRADAEARLMALVDRVPVPVEELP